MFQILPKFCHPSLELTSSCIEHKVIDWSKNQHLNGCYKTTKNVDYILFLVRSGSLIWGMKWFWRSMQYIPKFQTLQSRKHFNKLDWSENTPCSVRRLGYVFWLISIQFLTCPCILYRSTLQGQKVRAGVFPSCLPSGEIDKNHDCCYRFKKKTSVNILIKSMIITLTKARERELTREFPLLESSAVLYLFCWSMCIN